MSAVPYPARAGKPGGKVWLVAAGPGDPDLLTVKGLRCLKEADAVVYDALVDEALLAVCRPGAELLYAGKRQGKHSLPQEEISALLVRLGAEGKRVVRLKGGDPFVFGRGGEEALALAAAGIEYEVVPGVTAGVAVPAYAHIPVTHRGVAASVTFVTAHGRKEDLEPVRWADLARIHGTLVVFMGLTTLRDITRALVLGGRGPSTPAAVISSGTTPRQREVVGTLADLADRVEDAGLETPALLVVGEVVTVRGELAALAAQHQAAAVSPP